VPRSGSDGQGEVPRIDASDLTLGERLVHWLKSRHEQGVTSAHLLAQIASRPSASGVSARMSRGSSPDAMTSPSKASTNAATALRSTSK